MNDDIPSQCPKLSTPWPLTVKDLHMIGKFQKPDERYLKRMKINEKQTNSITSFLVTKEKKRITQEMRKLASQYREDYIADSSVCEFCNMRTIYNSRDATVSCVGCANSDNYNAVDTSYREGVSIHSVYLYKQINHFKDHLKRVCGTESTLIAPDIIEVIKQELRKQYKNLSMITPEDIRRVLKKKKLTKLYNHRNRIYKIVSGNATAQITPEQECELCHLFEIILPVWNDIRPPGRSSFLRYEYILQKLCLLLGYDDIAKYFKLLKSREKLVWQDEKWELICKRLNFDYTPSLMP
jgi:hypothetical protein